MHEFIWYTLSGAAVGFVVGMTGVGGGSFMTPILLAFGIPPATAVGTDLLYASITKSGGIIAHSRQKTIDWQIVGILSAGSLPASGITIFILHYLQKQAFNYTNILTTTLGLMLIITSAVLLLRSLLIKKQTAHNTEAPAHRPWLLTWIMGVFLGIVVTLSSVGAGAFGAVILMLLYPHLSIIRTIGTDLAHAVPLTAIAGLGHLHLGNVDYTLLISLILGSLPAIWLGTRCANHIPEKTFRPLMALILLLLGLKYLLK